MGDRREQMTIVGPDFRLARLESGRGVNGVAGSHGAVGSVQQSAISIPVGSATRKLTHHMKAGGGRGDGLAGSWAV
jgi:hypothetical protein